MGDSQYKGPEVENEALCDRTARRLIGQEQSVHKEAGEVAVSLRKAWS